MSVTIVTLPPMRVAAVGHTGPYDRISDAFGTLGRLAGPAGLFGAPGAMMVALYHDDPETTPAERLRSDAGVTVAAGASLPAGLAEAHVVGGRFATLTHVGPYETLSAAWTALKAGLAAAGHRRRAGVSLEIYRNTPMDTPKEKLVTEIYIPIE